MNRIIVKVNAPKKMHCCYRLTHCKKKKSALYFTSMNNEITVIWKRLLMKLLNYFWNTLGLLSLLFFVFYSLFFYGWLAVRKSDKLITCPTRVIWKSITRIIFFFAYPRSHSYFFLQLKRGKILQYRILLFICFVEILLFAFFAHFCLGYSCHNRVQC